MSNSTATANTPKTDAAVSASDLRAAFDTNVLAAERKYTGRSLRVAGRAGPVRKAAKGGYFFDLEQLPCHLSRDGEPAAVDLLPGQAVVVTGTLCVTPLGAQCNLEMKDSTVEVVAPEVKAEAEEPNRDAPKKKEPDATKKESYDLKITVRQWNVAKKQFQNPESNVPAFRYDSKDGGVRFYCQPTLANNSIPTVKSELVVGDDTWVIEKAVKLTACTVCHVKLKPAEKKP